MLRNVEKVVKTYVKTGDKLGNFTHILSTIFTKKTIIINKDRENYNLYTFFTRSNYPTFTYQKTSKIPLLITYFSLFSTRTNTTTTN